MEKFVILSDTSCDLPEAFQQKYNIEILPGHLILPDKSDIPAFLKWERYTREEFYKELKENPNGFATSPPNVAEYTAVFEKNASEGKPVLCLTISSGISGSYGFAVSAKKTVLSKYPDAEIEILDTLRFGPAIGLMTVHAAEMRDSGKSLKETYEYLENCKYSYHQAGWLDDLSFVAKKGRVTHAKAFLGTIVGIKSIGEFDYNGLTTVIAKIKGAKAAYDALLKYIDKTIVNPSEQVIFIAQSNRLEQAQIYKQKIEEKFSPKAVYIHDVFPSCGVNVGPGLMAAYYMGKPISKDLSEEKSLIEKAINGEI